MSRVCATVAIVLSAVGLVLVGSDVLNFNLGLPSLPDLFYYAWPNVTSGFGTAATEYTSLTIVIAGGLVVALLVARFPKYGKY